MGPNTDYTVDLGMGQQSHRPTSSLTERKESLKWEKYIKLLYIHFKVKMVNTEEQNREMYGHKLCVLSSMLHYGQKTDTATLKNMTVNTIFTKYI